MSPDGGVRAVRLLAQEALCFGRQNEFVDARQQQLNFLKALILQTDQEEGHRLLNRIVCVQRHERLRRRWLGLIGFGLAVLLGLIAATKSWAWVLVLVKSDHLLAQAILWIAGMAIFSLVLVLGSWLWYRNALKDLIGDTQRFLAGWLANREPPAGSSPQGPSPPTQRRREVGSPSCREPWLSGTVPPGASRRIPPPDRLR